MTHIITNTLPYIANCFPPVSSQPGMVWYDSGEQCFKVYDGSFWIRIDWPMPSMTWEADLALNQMINLMKGDNNLSKLANKYPLVAEALGQLEVALKLCENIDVNKP